MSKPIYILNGPNLNLLGVREPELYGSTTLAEVETMSRASADALGHALEFRQTNHEGELITWIQEAREKSCGVIINAAAYTHTSVGVLDALKMLDVPVIELHISVPMNREDFRHHSFVTPAATAMICGLGVNGYPMSVEALAKMIAS